LSIAEEWDIPSLKDKITREIVEDNKLIQRLPHTIPKSQLLIDFKYYRTYPDIPSSFTTVLEAAEIYHAEELEKFLKEFMENNGALLSKYSESRGITMMWFPIMQMTVMRTYTYGYLLYVGSYTI
jgi:hypothetical protein